MMRYDLIHLLKAAAYGGDGNSRISQCRVMWTLVISRIVFPGAWWLHCRVFKKGAEKYMCKCVCLCVWMAWVLDFCQVESAYYLH